MKTHKHLEEPAQTGGILPEQLEKINRHTRRPLAAEEVFVFSLILCDNEVDRDNERFSIPALHKLAELFVGKTGVFDHNPKAENQSARIFETQVITPGGTTLAGEPYTQLKAWAYLLRCEKNQNLLLEIDGGIKKEVSVGCAVEQAICSICGSNRRTQGCLHQKGQQYGDALCCDILENPTDAYEWSFVAVPAQKRAGVVKGYQNHMQGGMEMNIAKLLSQEEPVALNGVQRAGLQQELARLKVLAQAGETFVAETRREVLKLAGFAAPQADTTLLEKALCRLNLAELQELKKAFAPAAALLPVEPQLAPAQAAPEQNESFRI